MYGIDVIISNHFIYDGDQMSLNFRQGGIIIIFSCIFNHPVGMFVKIMVGTQGFRFQVHCGTKRIEPSVKFKTSGVSLGNHPFERVIIRTWRFSFFSSQITGPRRQISRIKCFAGTTNLHDNGIIIQFFIGVQNFDEIGFLFFDGVNISLWPINVGNGGYPNCPEFILGICNFFLRISIPK